MTSCRGMTVTHNTANRKESIFNYSLLHFDLVLEIYADLGQMYQFIYIQLLSLLHTQCHTEIAIYTFALCVVFIIIDISIWLVCCCIEALPYWLTSDLSSYMHLHINFDL